MSSDATEAQGGAERRRSLEISIQRERPPLEVPGYDPERYLGRGAYGEVWVAIERNTGRRVAIKFYTHRGGLDWSLLSREVEKLAFLFADRYVVQLLSVGWNAEPPYYIMEYLEQGSLADRLKHGPLPIAEAVDLFRYVAIGLLHAHGKGVLHCDLKPANILLDQDGKPRLADFGQSRLSDDQTPALGTLFYMAPEQANLTEAPNARWDVYALGAVLYCMLTGKPPHWSEEAVAELEATDDLKKRLSAYRRLIRKAPPLAVHRKVKGTDRQLAHIVENCLAAAPENRYPNVQAVLNALDARMARRSRRPLMLLGAFGPVLLLLIVAWFTWQGSGTAVSDANRFLTQRARQVNKFQAENLAKLAGYELDARLRAVSKVANSPELREAMARLTGPGSESEGVLIELAKSAGNMTPEEEQRIETLRCEYRDKNAARAELQKVFEGVVKRHPISNSLGWFLNDAKGTQVARDPSNEIIGKNYAWRTYFNGQVDDLAPTWRPNSPDMHIQGPHMSAVLRSQGTDRWIVALSAPVFAPGPGAAGEDTAAPVAEADQQRSTPVFLGVVAVMVEVGEFIKFEGENPHQLEALIDWRAGSNRGLVLQHPYLERLLSERKQVESSDIPQPRVEQLDEHPEHPGRLLSYVDPLIDKSDSRKRWIAHMAPVPIAEKQPRRDNCLVVVVQEDYEGSIGQTLGKLKRSLISLGMIVLAIIVLVMIGLWLLVIRMFRGETGEQVETEAGEVPTASTPSGSNSGSTPSATPTEPMG